MKFLANNDNGFEPVNSGLLPGDFALEGNPCASSWQEGIISLKPEVQVNGLATKEKPMGLKVKNQPWFKKLRIASLGLALLAPGFLEAANPGLALPAIAWAMPGIPNKASIALNQAIESFRRGDYDQAAKYFQEVESRKTDLSAQEAGDFKRIFESNQKALQARKNAASTLDLAEDLFAKGQLGATSDLAKKIAADEQYLQESDKTRLKKLTENLRTRNLQTKVEAGPSLDLGGKTTAGADQIGADQVRAFIAQGDFEAAEKLLPNLPASGVAEIDSPTRLKLELSKLKQDPKALLGLARKAYSDEELVKAESLAHAAEKASAPWTFAFSSDSPAKLLKEMQSGKEKTESNPVVKEPAPSSGTSFKDYLPSWNPLAKTSGKPTPAPGVKKETSVNATEEARGLMRDARKALNAGNQEQAKKLNDQAKTLKPSLNWWEDNPERIQSDILRAESKTVGTVSQETPGKPAKEQDDPRVLLRNGRKMMTESKLDEATRLMLRAKAVTNAKWGLFEDTPEKLRSDIERAQAKKDKDESARVLLEARKMFEDADFDSATKAAYRAQQLHGPYNIWDFGDRPQKLIVEIEAAKLRKKREDLAGIEKGVGTLSNDPGKVAKAKAKLAEGRVALKANQLETAAGIAFQVKGMKVKLEGKDTPEALLKEIEAAKGIPGTEVASANLEKPSAKKVQAIELLCEAKKLQTAGKLAQARSKALESQKLGAAFQAADESPEQFLLQLGIAARQQVDDLVVQSGRILNQTSGDSKEKYAQAQQALDSALQLGKAFGHDTQPLESRKEALARNQALASGKPALPEPMGNSTVAGGNLAESNHGKSLLEKARLELRSGQTVSARRLAVEAYQGPYGIKEEAANVLRSIDLEEVNQKTLEARRAFDAGIAAFNRREFGQAKTILAAVSDKNLDTSRLQRWKEIMLSPEMQPDSQDISLVKSPGPGGKSGETPVKTSDILETATQLREVKFGQMRQQGLDMQREATEKFQAGQMESAIEMLTEYMGEMNAFDLDPGKMAFLRRPVESRLQHFKLLKAQKEMIARETGSKEKKNLIGQKQLADDNKNKKVAELMKQFNQNFKEGKYLEAESYAMRAHELDSDNAMAAAAISMAKTQRNINVAKKSKTDKEKFFLDGLNDTDKLGPSLTIDKPVDTNPDMADRRNKRQNLAAITNTVRKSDKEREIESKLSIPVNLNFSDTPLKQAIEDIRSFYGINIVPDMPALEQENISLERPVTLKLEQVSLKSALNLLLHSVHLTYVIKDEVLQITTESHARGKLQTVTYQVGDLVIPIENFYSPVNSMTPFLGIPAGPRNNPNAAIGGPTPLVTPTGLNGGTQAGSPGGSSVNSGNATITTSKRNTQTMEEMLIKLVSSTVSPQSWNNMGGPGTIEYYPLTMCLVINQSPDIQEQVADLLASLRRLQDQEVAIEVRFISIAEDFYERIGLDFNLNIKTDRNTSRFEPQITSGQYKPAGYINDPNFDRMIGGISPAGSFTTDLDIPINNSSYGMSIPTFGGYPGIPGAGGIAMGLAFLSDIQVFLFMEAAQGDRRTNVMQAPKLTLFNGQNSNITVAENQFFVTAVEVQTLTNGAMTFVPSVSAFPFGVYMNIQALISADRRSVRLSIPVTMTNLVPGPVALYPVVVPIFPTQNLLSTNPGDPITFTQYIQQPNINTIQVQTTVSVPDGGTVLMGGIKRLSESRSEYGPPILSKIPYLNRLFKNVGYGREAESLLIMVTPRIIIQEEEEFFQTGYKAPPNIIP
ncbi:MAG: hypothetical protein EXR99_01165 [Gemmataceae bacterium]|nr:hypothetical protein [Gemmataceae bacterium]